MARPDRRNPFEQVQSTTAMVSDQTMVDLYFDYNTVPDEYREALRRSAMAIKPRLKRAAEDIFVIGRELTMVKARLPHGTYTNWLDIEFGLSDRMAQRFMGVAERLGSKSDIMSVLPPTTLYLLAAPSTPDEAIATIEQQLTRGERVTVSYVQQIITDAKQRCNPPQAKDTIIDGEVIRSTIINEGEDRHKAAGQRLEKVFTAILDLLSNPAGEDWEFLFHTDELNRLCEEVRRLQQTLRKLQ